MIALLVINIEPTSDEMSMKKWDFPGIDIPEEFRPILERHLSGIEKYPGSQLAAVWAHQCARAIRIAADRNWDAVRLERHLAAASELLWGLQHALNAGRPKELEDA